MDTVPRSPIRDAPAALFVTDNGHGLGHLTRLLAVARKSNQRFRPLFLSLSEGYPVLRDAGYPVEYLPSYVKLGLARSQWQPIFAHRLLAILRHVQPRAVVVDHISPPAVIGDIRSRTRGVEWVWSRRGMWRKGYNHQALDLSANFDVIVEPSDVAAPVDAGVTTLDRDRVLVVPPILLVAPEEQVDRKRARAELGLPPDGRAVLIQLSDSNSVKLVRLMSQVRDVVRDVGGADISLFAPLHVLHRGRLPTVEGVVMRPVYPIARYLRAFDAVISTAGYNSYHEVVASGLPAVFVARDTASLDDQRRRAEFAALSGRGFFAESPFQPEFRVAVQMALRPDEPVIAARVTEELGAFDGAQVTADFLGGRVTARRWEHFEVPQYRDLDVIPIPIDFRSGPSDPEIDTSSWPRVGYVLAGVDPERVRELVAEIREEHDELGRFIPVFLVEDVQPDIFDECGFQFETVLSRSEWEHVGVGPYDNYLSQRISTFPMAYQLSRSVDLRPRAFAAETRAP